MESMKSIFQLPTNSTEFIPHRETMLLVDELLQYGEGKIRGTAKITRDNPFLDESGAVGQNCLVEIMAQTVAAGNGYDCMLRGDTLKTGFLVGVNDFSFYEDVRIGDELTITTKEESSFGDFSFVEGSINAGSRLIAKGNLKLYEIKGAPEKTADWKPPEEGDGTAEGRAIPVNDKTPFFKAISRSSINFHINDDKEQVTSDFCFKDNFPGFKGHFPQFPILPGVIMMETIMVLAETLCRKELKIINISKAKFSRQSYPGDLLSGEVSITSRGNLRQINAKLTCNGRPVSSLILEAASK
ncbi:MAG: hypothetical protein OEV42_11570 [Deltaproteobacteria bacterium]|nr:hypothetical protein [Deltaproteobacteria bacterium]